MAEKEKILQDFALGFTPRELWDAHQKRMAELVAKLLDEVRVALPETTWRRLQRGIDHALAPEGQFYEGIMPNWRFIVGRFNEDNYDGTATQNEPLHIIRLPRDIAHAAVEAAELKLKEEKS